ncbi:acid protease [Peniophora sp. CONT]|nr:acid protease [Peniophora sp. CONT]
MLSASAMQGHPHDHTSRTPSFLLSPRGLKMRPMLTTTSSSDGSTANLNNFDLSYQANITLGGSEFTVVIDTGSSDLVLLPDLPIETTSVIPDSQINDTYGVGWFAGSVAVATLEFGGHTVKSQAFLNATSASDAPAVSDMLSVGIRGILGIELSTFGSLVQESFISRYGFQKGEKMGRTVLANIFDQNADLGNFTVIRLGRSDDGEGPGESYLDVGEYPEDLKDHFANTSSIETIRSTDFSIFVDALTVNEKKVSLKSAVRGTPSGKTVANLDTGTSVALVTKDIRDAIYSSIPGAWFSDIQDIWVVPCLTGLNITFTIGGQEFHVHPLDVVDVNDLRPQYNFTTCTSSSSIGVLDFDTSQFDFILGDTFLRNTVTSYYYGDFGANGTDVIKSPSVKLVSTSNGVDADYSDFLTRRRQNLASLPPEATKAQAQKIIAETQSNNSDVSTAKELASSGSSSGNSYQALLDKLNTYAPVVFGLLGAIFVVLIGLLGVGIALCIRRSRTVGTVRTVNPLYSPVPLRFKEPESEYKDEENVRYGQ